MTDYFSYTLDADAIRAISSIGLAHLGDAVYELLVRTYLCAHGKATGKGLHRATVELVRAPKQAELAEAEAAAHGVDVDEVHFHEVGAVDSIADVVAAAVCLDDLDVTDVVVPVLCEGQGTVRCQHGVIPVPVPAVVNVAAAHGIPLRILDVQGELVTPTGAALVAAVRTRSRLPERFVVERVGVGAGKRAYDTPGILRALVVREDTE